jgi:hypothetical protein
LPECRMRPLSQRCCLSFAAILIGALSITNPAAAITADLAKKCRDMAIKAHPPTLPGAKTGSAQAERDSYRACIANGGTSSDNETQRTVAPTETQRTVAPADK